MVSAPAIMGAFQTQGRLFELETLGPGVALRFSFCQRKVFFMLGMLAFAVVIGIGLYSSKRFKGGSPLGWVCLTLFFVPLGLSWFAEGDAGEPYTAAYLGGAALCTLFLYRKSVELWHARRDAILDAAPDPFIENASDAKTEPPQPVEATAKEATPSEKKDSDTSVEADEIDDETPDAKNETTKGGGK